CCGNLRRPPPPFALTAGAGRLLPARIPANGPFILIIVQDPCRFSRPVGRQKPHGKGGVPRRTCCRGCPGPKAESQTLTPAGKGWLCAVLTNRSSGSTKPQTPHWTRRGSPV